MKLFFRLVAFVRFRPGAIVAFLLISVGSAVAGDDVLCPRGCTVSGKIDNAPRGAALVVELAPLTESRISARSDIDPAGDFSLDSVHAGDYQVQVVAPGGQIIYQNLITVSGDNYLLSIHLPESPLARPASGTVSARRLALKIPGKALNELKKSEQASQKGDAQKSMDHLLNAIQICPGYLEAHNNLGVRYLRLNRTGEALAEFQKANQIDPDDPLVNVNLSSALLILERYADSEAAARRALKLDPANDKARYLLALCLKAQNTAPREALTEFRRVASQFPKARLASAQILVQQGRRDEAITELKQYLGGAVSTSDRQMAESWLSMLQQ